MRIWLLGYQCGRCGHQWKPLKKGTPIKCPACDSRNWQQPEPGKGAPSGNGADQVAATGRVRGTPAHELAEGLRGLTWPDLDFADDPEEAIKVMRAQCPAASEDDLMGIWQGSGPENEVEEFLEWRRGEGRREAEEFEES